MSDLKLGQIIVGEASRDAIHVAVAPVVAWETLKPGQHVGLLSGNATPAGLPHIGIVDPFLKKSVKEGEKLWLFLYPNTIKGLRHEWTHPAFPELEVSVSAKTVADSKKWLTEKASYFGFDYDEFMSRITGFIDNHAEILVSESVSEEELDDEFLGHYENVTGKRVDRSANRWAFKCAC